MNRAELKNIAKRQLQDNYKKAIIILLINGLIISTVSTVVPFVGVLLPVLSLVINGLYYIYG